MISVRELRDSYFSYSLKFFEKNKSHQTGIQVKPSSDNDSSSSYSQSQLLQGKSWVQYPSIINNNGSLEVSAGNSSSGKFSVSTSNSNTSTNSIRNFSEKVNTSNKNSLSPYTEKETNNFRAARLSYYIGQ